MALDLHRASPRNPKPVELPPLFYILSFAAFGLCVGSFLNVCIYRYGLENETVRKPRRSRCPSCKRELTWRDNIPVLSWTLLRGKCRSCGWRIPWRYPLVELLTGGLWALVAWRAGLPGEGTAIWGLAVVQVVILSALVVTTFVDFDHFEIPDSVSIGGMWAAPVVSALLPELHAASPVAEALADGEVDRLAALLTSLLGLVVGGGVLWLVGVLGTKAFGRDAMGFGDVKLLAAGGGFVGPGGALAALLVGALVASVFGILNMLRFYWVTRRRARSRRAHQSRAKAVRVARVCGRYVPFGPFLGIGIGIVLLDWNHVLEFWKGLGF